MIKKILSCVAGTVGVLLVYSAVWWYYTLPEVWVDSISGKFICAIDADGNKIPRASLGKVHKFPEPARECPKKDKGGRGESRGRP